MTEYLPEVECSGLSIVGLVREDNQDAIHLHKNNYAPEWGQLYVVADGMGGYSHGEIASNLALEAMSSTLFESKVPNPNALKIGVERANLSVYNTAQKLGIPRMGTTLTAAYVLGNILYLAHVGDSRAYIVRQGRAKCITTDHTAVGDMVRAKILSPNKIRTHANRSILTRAIGIGLFVQAEITQQTLQEGDRIILCSDGLWSVIEDDEFAQISEQHQIESVCQALVDLAVQRETDDNVSVVALQVNRLNPVSQKSAHMESPRWLYKLRNLTR